MLNDGILKYPQDNNLRHNYIIPFQFQENSMQDAF